MQINHRQSHILQSFPRQTSRSRLRVVTVIESPFTLLHSDKTFDAVRNTCQVGMHCMVYEKDVSNNGNSSEQRLVLVPKCCIGYMMDFLNRLKSDLNVDVDIYSVKDKSYGAIKKGKWRGMVGDVLYGKADIAVAALTITAKRMNVVDYSAPFMTGGIGIVTLMDQSHLPFINVQVFEPLSFALWLTTLGLTLLTSMLLVLSERMHIPAHAYSWKSSITYVVGLLFQHDLGGQNPQKFATRVVSIGFAITVMVIMSTYTAVLTANKVTTRDRLPIKGFDDPKVCYLPYPH